MRRSNFQSVLAYIGLVALVGAFASLGFWQLQRAQDSRRPIVIDRAVLSLDSLAKPRTSLDGSAVLRTVIANGKYIARFEAPNQMDASGMSANWEVNLLQVSPTAAILVARGLWSDRGESDFTKNYSIEATVMPHQNDAHAESAAGVLSRIDSALVVNETTLDLYDGFLIVAKESITENGVSTSVTRTRLDPPTPKSGIPGFYWQHVSYVIIWWLMGCVVLYLPFYQRKIKQTNPTKVSST